MRERGRGNASSEEGRRGCDRWRGADVAVGRESFGHGMGRKDTPFEDRQPGPSACYPQLAAAYHKWRLQVEMLMRNEPPVGDRDPSCALIRFQPSTHRHQTR
jgi:hypothetical protein